MYPGTYQPLQALALLLADLLQQPNSDEAPLTRGLVDAIFDLYQVGEGMVSQNDPPQRQLSAAGREAWSMLVRARKIALERVGQDSHVLLPTSVSASDFCVCGERIVASRPGQGTHHASAEQSSVSQMAALQPEGSLGLTDPTMNQMNIPGVSFDWDEWDAYIGDSTGLLP